MPARRSALGWMLRLILAGAEGFVLGAQALLELLGGEVR